MFYLREKAEMNQLRWNALFMKERGPNEPAALELSFYEKGLK